MDINIATVQIPCEFCGELHDEYAIDGHVCVPHLCSNCWLKVVEKWEQEPKCVECRHCTYIHEYKNCLCEIRKWSMDGDFRYMGCEYFERKTEE